MTGTGKIAATQAKTLNFLTNMTGIQALLQSFQTDLRKAGLRLGESQGTTRGAQMHLNTVGKQGKIQQHRTWGQ